MSTKEMTGRDVNWRTGINMVDPETGLTPLMVAAIQGKQPIALALLERGADLNYIETRKGRTALHIAARAGHVGVLQELLKRDPRVNSTDRFQKTPLMHAAKGGYLDCVSALISRQAGVNMTDENGFSALHYAARWGHYQVAGALIIAGGAIELRDEFDGKTGNPRPSAPMPCLPDPHSQHCIGLRNMAARRRSLRCWTLAQRSTDGLPRRSSLH